MNPTPFLNTITLNFLRPIDSESMISIIVLIGLLATSALISGAEVAFFALKPQELVKINNQESK